MKEDKILMELFKTERWEKAIEVGVGKDIDKGELRKLCNPEVRRELCKRIVTGQYAIAPVRQALIPKDNGEYRTVYICENIDRVFLSIVNEILLDFTPDMIHKSCKSYQHGIGTGKVVREVSSKIVNTKPIRGYIGWKSDLSKYFDSVPIEYIDKAFDEVEKRCGKSKVIDVLREFYHCNLCFDTEGNLIEHYKSLGQGVATASWLANAVLHHIDEKLSKLDGYYVRYSDDCLFIGKDYHKAMRIMERELKKMNMKLNPKKVEYLTQDKFFKFLGFSIRGSEISLSKNRIKTFQKEIKNRTIKNKDISYQKALNNVNNFLYKGDGQYSWATSVLPIITVEKDVNTLNAYVMDCLRAVQTGRKKVGGLGYECNKKVGVVTRGTGKNVRSNRERTGHLDGYLSLNAYRKAPKAVRHTLVMSM